MAATLCILVPMVLAASCLYEVVVYLAVKRKSTFVDRRTYDWPRYQPRRVVRLAIPTCAAVGLCCAVFSIPSWGTPRDHAIEKAGKIERRRPHPPWRMGPSSFTGNHHQTSPPGAEEQEPVIGPVQLDVGGI